MCFELWPPLRSSNDASQAQIPPGDFDPLIVEAIHAGAAQAALLSAAGSVSEPQVRAIAIHPGAGRPNAQTSEVFGPFVVYARGHWSEFCLLKPAPSCP